MFIELKLEILVENTDMLALTNEFDTFKVVFNLLVVVKLNTIVDVAPDDCPPVVKVVFEIKLAKLLLKSIDVVELIGN